MITRLILAPACTGKSHFAKAVKTGLGIPVVDGDDLISAAGLWPAGEWWHSPDAEETHEAHVHRILSILSHNTDLVVVFNGQPELFVKHTKLNPRFGSIGIVGVVYPREHYLATADLRQSSSHGYKPSGRDAADQAEAMHARYTAAGLHVFDSFTEVGKALRLYMKRFKELTPSPDEVDATARHLLNIMGLV